MSRPRSAKSPDFGDVVEVGNGWSGGSGSSSSGSSGWGFGGSGFGGFTGLGSGIATAGMGGSGGGYDFMDAFSFGLNMGELARQGLSYQHYGASVQKVEAALKQGKYIHRGDVYWQGNYPKVTNSMNNSLSGAQFARNLGKGMTGVSAGIAVYDFYQSDKSGADYAKLVGSGLIMSSAFIPVVGPFISIGLGMADSFGAFDSIYNYFD